MSTINENRPLGNTETNENQGLTSRHAGPDDVSREAELRAPSRVACSDLFGKMFSK